jgi:peroxiredoxin/predicted 2-oxoglutarate/Fe(II)-dependent dioxygenase YbiX
MADANYRLLLPGDPAPWFQQRSTANPRYVFDTAAGRYIVLCFYGTAGDEAGRSALAAVESRRELFDDAKISLFGVSCDPEDEQSGRVQQSLPGIRHFWDFDVGIARLYGAAPANAEPGQKLAMRRFWAVLSPRLRVMHIIPFAPGGADASALFRILEALPDVAAHAGPVLQAPVLFLPDVFEPGFCRTLIDFYETKGGEESGFMREVGGKTIGVSDHSHKRRRDCVIEDEPLMKAAQARVSRRIVPEIARAYQFHVTRMERYIVGCYTAEDGGHFNAHRDNTTSGTAHRRFAVSINLNAEFEGGEVSFPEYGPRGFKPPPGGAVVFSCSLLHAVSVVTSGKRYAFLPFLYDDAAARVRAENNKNLDAAVPMYQGV